MAQYNYGIGTTLLGIIYFEDMPVTGWPHKIYPPRGNFKPFSVQNDRGDGQVSGHGWPMDVWTWDTLYQSMVDYIRTTYCPGPSASLFFSTRNDTGAFATYSGILVWPSQELMSKRYAMGKYLGLSFELRRLQVAS